jgi:hypothetical protein
MADPTPDEVAAAIATLQAFEHAREVAVAASTQPQVASSEAVAVAQAVAVLASPVAVVAVDPYVARSLKDSPNGF